MKTKRTFLSILTLCIALLFTACSGKEAASTEKSQDTKTESSSVSTDDSISFFGMMLLYHISFRKAST